MAGLALVAGTAMGQNENVVVAGGTYNYSLDGIYSVGAATATVSYGGTNATITEVGGSYTIPTETSTTVDFEIQYATNATSGIITVNVSDGTCTNFIEYSITVTTPPSINLAVADAADYGCQDLAASPLTDNTSAADDVAASSNSFTFDISASITDEPVDFDATADIAVTGGGDLSDLTVTYSGQGSYTGGASGTLTWDENDSGVITGTFTVTFTTSTGFADQTVNLTASSVSVTENGGGADYDETATANNDDNVVVNAMPSIGGFN
jgi:hypothetical protein